MTLATIRLNLYRRLNFGDAPDAAVTTRLTMFVNQRYRTLLTTPALRRLREGRNSATTIAGQAEYGLQAGYARITAVRDRTNQRRLTPMAFDTYLSMDIDPTRNTSTPTHYVPVGMRAVHRRPSGWRVWIVSEDPADTTQIATVQASFTVDPTHALPGGLVKTLTRPLNGTTRVELSVNELFDDIFTVSLSAPCLGAVHLYDAAAGGNSLTSIPIGLQTSRYFVIALYPTPSASLVYDIDYEHALIDLVNAWDEPLIPEDFQDLLILGALMDEYQHRDDNRYSAAAQEYRARVSDLQVWLYGHRAATQKGVRPELAPLGSWFPAQY